jgi:hypothetical protein
MLYEEYLRFDGLDPRFTSFAERVLAHNLDIICQLDFVHLATDGHEVSPRACRRFCTSGSKTDVHKVFQTQFSACLSVAASCRTANGQSLAARR